MNPGTMFIVALLIIQISRSESAGILEMVSNYARVAKNERTTTTTTTTERVQNFSLSVLPLDNDTTPIEYEDFDDIEEDRALKENQSKRTMMTYFNAIVSFLAFLYKFNGSFGKVKPETLHFKNQNEPRIAKHYSQAQDRFEFPQKKFKHHGDDAVDDSYQPIENYPPYDPLKANTAETYNNDGKSSYDVDLTQNSVNDVDVQQSYSYEVPYDQQWNNPWMMTKTPDDKPTFDSYQPWQPDTSPKQQFPVYHHADPHPPEHHDMDHFVDEDRVSKKPYSYYFLGRKLWYVPLLFSVYFIIYIGALVLKSVARHKIQFPEKVWNLHDDHFGHGSHRRHRKVDDLTENYEKAVEKMNNKFM